MTTLASPVTVAGGGLRRLAPYLASAIALLAISAVSISSAAVDPVRWTPDGLFYEARLLEFRGADRDSARRDVFEGPLAARARAIDPEHVANPSWVAYNQKFYERRLAVPLAGAALYPIASERSILYISMTGYLAAVLAVFILLLLRFSLPIATVVSLATAVLPALTTHSAYPLTDSWGLALETGALAAAILTLDRSLRWLPLFIGTVLVLSFTRDSSWIPVLAVVWCAFRFRTQRAIALGIGGVAAVLPALLLYSVPLRELVALNVFGHDPAPNASWWSIVEHYPGALVDHLRSNLGSIRRGEWYTGSYLIGGIALLFLLTRRSRETVPTVLKAGAVVALLYVMSIPAFSAFRVELILVPMAASGLAYGVERLSLRRAFFSRRALST